MYIREYMHTDMITVTSDTTVNDAKKVMLEKGIRRLPVVDKGKLVGVITRGKIREATGHHATSLDKWELNYALAKMKVKEIMETHLFTVTPDTAFEKAVSEAQERGIGTILVVDPGKPSHLLGIATTTDLYKIITQILGFGQPGARLHIIEPTGDDACERALHSLVDEDVRIRSFFHVTRPGAQREDCIIHTNLGNPANTVRQLTEMGFKVEVRNPKVEAHV